MPQSALLHFYNDYNLSDGTYFTAVIILTFKTIIVYLLIIKKVIRGDQAI